MRKQAPLTPLPDTDGLDVIQQNLERLRAALGVTDASETNPHRAESKPLKHAASGEDPPMESMASAAETEDPDASTLTRAQRLERMKTMLKREAVTIRQQAEALAIQRKHAFDVLEQRQQLIELQRLLGDAEQRMMRRWGIHQAFGWTIRALVCLGILLGLSLFAAEPLSKQVWVATAIVRHSDADPVQDETWRQSQEKILREPVTVAAVVSHLQKSDDSGPARTQEVRDLLDEGLSVAAPGSGVLHLELAGTQKTVLEPILHALIQVYLNRIASENPQARRPLNTQSAQLASSPIFDNRSQITAILFASSVGAMVLIIAFFALIIVRTRRGEVAAVHNESIGNEDAWKSYRDALERDGRDENRPLF